MTDSSDADQDADGNDHVAPFVHRTRHTLALHFSIHELQSLMRISEPDALALGYTRLMMGFLLFKPQPARIGMLGLGGGSLAKFCYRYLPQAQIDVVEINPHVLALRNEFEVPHDDARLRIQQGDGARWVRESPETFDVLMVDGYDYTGLPSILATQRFYDDCAAALAPGGLLVLNLFRGHWQHPLHMDRLRRSFDDAVLEVEDADQANSMVLAGSAEVLCAPITQSVLTPPEGMDAAAWASLHDELTQVTQTHAKWRTANIAGLGLSPKSPRRKKLAE